jgi:hypothetical protein
VPGALRIVGPNDGPQHPPASKVFNERREDASVGMAEGSLRTPRVGASRSTLPEEEGPQDVRVSHD